MSTDLDEIEAQLHSTHPLGSGDKTDQRSVYRRFARLLHPDTRSGIDPVRADRLFRLLETAWSSLTSTPGTATEWELSTKRHHYLVTLLTGQIGCTNQYSVTWLDGDQHYGHMRLPRSAKDNDLVEAEIRALRQLTSDVDLRYQAYFPELVDTFRHRDAITRVDRRGSVLAEEPSGFISLAELHEIIPVLNPRDMAWIFRRLLTAIGAGHRAGLINGAILPEFVFIQPDEHGVILPVWQYSTSEGPIRAIPKDRRDWYPPEVLNKDHPSEATDIYMAAKLHLFMTGPGVGKDGRYLRAFMDSCISGSQRARPGDAWGLLSEYNDLIEDLWGPRTFRKLIIPTH